MKKVTITLYAFSELSKEAQTKALTENRTINVPFGWHHAIEQGAAETGIHIAGFDIDKDIPVVAGIIRSSHIEVAIKTMEKYPPETRLHRIAYNFIAEQRVLEESLNEPFGKLSMDQKKGIETERFMSEKTFLLDVSECYAYMLKSDYYEKITDQAVIKTFEENEHTFEQDGRMNNSNGDEQEEEMPIGIMDLSPDQLSESLIKKIMDHKPYTYKDTNDLQEHLYSLDCVIENFQGIGLIITQEEETELDTIREKMNVKNCGYFRIIVI